MASLTYGADLSGDKVAESIEPLDVGFEVAGLLHVLKGRLDVGILLGERLDELFRPDKRQSFQLNVRQLLGQSQWTGTHLRHIRLLGYQK